MSEATTLKLTAIRIDGDTQLRAETNQEIIANYARDMQDGDIFPPVVVYYDGINYWLSDGFHRYLATEQIGEDEILATIRGGTRRDALLYAAEANRKHGKAFTNKDKRRIVTLFLNDPEWSKWSDREIARRCGVSNTFVSNVRAQLSTVDSYEGLSEYVIKELEEKNLSPDSIAALAEYARNMRADVKGNAGKTLLIGSWMLGCKEGDYPRIGDTPYTQEQLEKEGLGLWCLHPMEIDAFIQVGKLERTLHEVAMIGGKDFFDITDDDMLKHCSYEKVIELAGFYTTVVFRCGYSIWHYLTIGLSQDAKDKMHNREITTLADAYKYDEEKRQREREEWYKNYKLSLTSGDLQ